MQRLIFEYSPVYFILCLALGTGYAWLLYSAKYSWGKNWNRILFTLRLVLATTLMVLLLGPILKLTENIFEKPSFVVLIDNSQSVKETTNTQTLLTRLQEVKKSIEEKNNDVEWRSFDGVTDTIHFDKSSSDLTTSLRETINRYEGRNLAGIILVSDGIYNDGLSPLYLPIRIPVYTVGVGDTTERADVVLRNVAYNRIVYQGNKFPLRAEVGVAGLTDQEIVVSVEQQGKIVQQQKKNSGKRGFLDFDFQLDAGTQGMQRFEVRVERVARETNLKNNRSSAFVEVVEGKKKILLIAPAPHPDIKALRTVIEKNSNYGLEVHIPGIVAANPEFLQHEKVDLLIAFHSPDQEGKTTALLNTFIKGKSSVLVIVGQKTALRSLPGSGVPITFDGSGQKDEVQPVLNINFSDFGFSDGLNTNISRFPPVSVPFGKFSYPATAKMILNQRIGSIITDRPMLYTTESDQQKIAVLTADGIWKWKLNEYRETEKTLAFDELFSKLIQYLSTRDDRRKFRCFPLQHEFNSDGPVVMESQVYNELFEPVYGNTVELELKDEKGKITPYRYVIGQGSSRYRIGGLKEGVYRYKASTEVKGIKEEVSGEFLVTEQNREAQNLTADFNLLRKLSQNTGARFFTQTELDKMNEVLARTESRSLIHTDETFNPLINLKSAFWILLGLVSLEWFLRKYFGSY
ncbi:MAG TPA: hypothetical protein PLR06_02670 [Cyclobacteriaceae bacterium]|nr:hypothetical protein [Cyclobacteriaceae bacterium]